jgi:spermidine/putrescine-binding protein
MKKKIILFILGIFLLTGCSSSNENGVVNVLNWSSYIPDVVISNFEKEYNIKVHYGTYSSNEELLAKISSSKKGTYDLIFPSDYMIELMKERHLLEEFDKTQLKNISNINPRFLRQEYDPNNEYSIPFLLATTTIAVNRDNIKEPITSYQDLLNEKYKNNIVLIDDQRIVIGAALQGLGYDINDTDKEHLEEAYQYLMKLKKNIKAFDSDSPKTFMISKETNIGVMWNAEAAIALDNNPSMEIVYPEEGFGISIDNFVLPVGAKNLEVAYAFIDYILRPDIMKKIIESYPYKCVNKETNKLLDDTYLNNPAANISDEVFLSGTFVKNLGKYIIKYDKLWAKIK